MPMTRSRILEGTWYDHPEYYDIAFQVYTEREADFIEAACRKYCPFNARRLLEPACGTGRLVTALAARGYEVTGFDFSEPAFSSLRRQITRRRLEGTSFGTPISLPHVYCKPISKAARFGSIAGNLRGVRLSARP